MQTTSLEAHRSIMPILNELQKKSRSANSKSRFIAVVMRKDGTESQRPDGDYASFAATTEDAAIARALEMKKKWEDKGYGPYEVLTGELTDRVIVPVTYEVERL